VASVRVIVKLKIPSQEPEYVTFNWDIATAPVPMIDDEICFDDYLLQVRDRRYHVSAIEERRPSLTLHTGLTGRWARTAVTPDELRAILRDYPSVELLS
jgi:hypothetical protein